MHIYLCWFHEEGGIDYLVLANWKSKEHDPIWSLFFVFNMFNLFRIFENKPNAKILNLGCSNVLFIYLFIFIFTLFYFPLHYNVHVNVFLVKCLGDIGLLMLWFLIWGLLFFWVEDVIPKIGHYTSQRLNSFVGNYD